MEFPGSEDADSLPLFAVDRRHQFVEAGVVGVGPVRTAVVFVGDIGFCLLGHDEGVGNVFVTSDSVVWIIDNAVSTCCCAVEPPTRGSRSVGANRAGSRFDKLSDLEARVPVLVGSA